MVTRCINLKKIVGSNNFSAQFIKIISHYKKKMAITLMYCNRLHCLVVKPNKVGNFASSLIARRWRKRDLSPTWNLEIKS